MEEIVQIVLKIVLILLTALVGWGITKLKSFWPTIKAWILAKTDLITEEQLDTLVSDLVAAADQTLKGSDPTGELRNQYVTTSLKEAGVELTSAVLAKIEAKVLELGHNSVSASEQDAI